MNKKMSNQNCYPNPLKKEKKFELWRRLAGELNLNEQEKTRLDWMIYYEGQAKNNVIDTCRHFSISRKTFYKWRSRFITGKKNIESLKNRSGKPHVKRNWEVTIDQERRIIALRKRYIHYSKNKLKVLYAKEYGEEISGWKIERVIRKHKLYPQRKNRGKPAYELVIERKNRENPLIKIEKKSNLCFRFQLMTTRIYRDNVKRYIIFAIERDSKLGYVRMYKKKTAQLLKDFIYRINRFIQKAVEETWQMDPGKLSRFIEMETAKPVTRKISFDKRYVKKSTAIFRFIKTVENEWLYDGNVDFDSFRFNKALIAWLIEYNFKRPHQGLDFLTPIEYIKKMPQMNRLKKKLSPCDLVDAVATYIYNLNVFELETTSVKSISTNLGISQTTLWRSFKKKMNLTPKIILLRIKLLRAAVLLRKNPELTVKDIAGDIGYYNYDYFFRVFKKHFGVTPQKYRELKQKGVGDPTR